MHARRHGGQQLVWLALDRLRQHGAQRSCDRCGAVRWHRSVVRPRSRDGRWVGTINSCSKDCAHIAVREWDEIERRVPKVLRRVGGYNIDVFLPQSERPYTSDGSVNIAHLLVGSEGTLAWTSALTLQLAPLPMQRTLGVVNFPTLYQAMQCAQHIVKLKPSAVELVDRTMIDLARSNPAFQPVIEAALVRSSRGEPEAVLLVEFSAGDARSRLDQLVTLMADLGLPNQVVPMTDASSQKALWDVARPGSTS